MPNVYMASTPNKAIVPSLNRPGVGALVSIIIGLLFFMIVNVSGSPNGIIVLLMPFTDLASHGLHGLRKLILGNE